MDSYSRKSYFAALWDGITSSLTGLRLSFKHLWAARRLRQDFDVQGKQYFTETEGLVTLQYPYAAMPVPDNGRYRLHNEMDDCIVCDKCAKICPVDCIEIEPIKATEQVGTTSDGSPIRLYAARFDIDMAKCCYCGLCTTVCPTECLTMTKAYDYSEFDVRDMLYHFSNLSPEQAAHKQELLLQFQAEKAAAKAAASPEPAPAESKPKPKFVPKTKTTTNIDHNASLMPNPTQEIPDQTSPMQEDTPTQKPKFVPKAKPLIKKEPPSDTPPAPTENIAPTLPEDTTTPSQKPKFVPKAKPLVKKQAPKDDTSADEGSGNSI